MNKNLNSKFFFDNTAILRRFNFYLFLINIFRKLRTNDLNIVSPEYSYMSLAVFTDAAKETRSDSSVVSLAGIEAATTASK